MLKESLGEVYEDYNLVIAYDSGRPMESNWVRKQLKAIEREARNDRKSTEFAFHDGQLI